MSMLRIHWDGTLCRGLGLCSGERVQMDISHYRRLLRISIRLVVLNVSAITLCRIQVLCMKMYPTLSTRQSQYNPHIIFGIAVMTICIPVMFIFTLTEIICFACSLVVRLQYLPGYSLHSAIILDQGSSRLTWPYFNHHQWGFHMSVSCKRHSDIFSV